MIFYSNLIKMPKIPMPILSFCVIFVFLVLFHFFKIRFKFNYSHTLSCQVRHLFSIINACLRMENQVALLVFLILSILFPPAHTSILCSLLHTNSSTHSPNQTRPFYRTELVIAWCGESIEWVTSAAKAFDHVIVYSKCDGVPPPQLLEEKNVNMTTLPNVGVCDHTYLHHIVANWETLALWTVFYKGFQEKKCHPSTLVRHNMETYLRLLCCDGNDGLVGKNFLFTPTFQLFRYTSAHNAARSNFFTSNKTMGQWAASTFGYANSLQLFSFGPKFCHGGYFAAPRHLIHRHPISVYEAMKIQQVHTLEEVDHYIERTWDALLKMHRMECIANDTDIWGLSKI